MRDCIDLNPLYLCEAALGVRWCSSTAALVVSLSLLVFLFFLLSLSLTLSMCSRHYRSLVESHVTHPGPPSIPFPPPLCFKLGCCCALDL